MTGLFAWLPTLVAVITAALALGGARSRLDAITEALSETRAEYKALGALVQEVLTARAVTALHVETLRASVASLEAAREVDREVRHALRAEVFGQIARLEARLEELRRPH